MYHPHTNLNMDLVRTCVDIASNPKQTLWISPLIFLADAALCGIVVWKIPCTHHPSPHRMAQPLTKTVDTEIDWIAYMQQVTQYIAGERDYTKLYGDTGPLVYPAAHVYIYRLLHYVTNEGTDIRTAQYIFVALYLSTLLLVMQCYRQAKVPPHVFPLLILSKRLHSIFMLRLFNDGFAVFFLFLAIFCYQRRLWTAGSLAYSFGLCVKMSLLLALPAVGVVLWQGMGRDRALRQAVVMGQLQVGAQFTRYCVTSGLVLIACRSCSAIHSLLRIHGATFPAPLSSHASSCSSGRSTGAS